MGVDKNLVGSMQGEIKSLKQTIDSMTGSSSGKCASEVCELKKKLEKAEEEAKKNKAEADEKLREEAEEKARKAE